MDDSVELVRRYNCAVANGLILKAKRIERLIKALDTTRHV